MARPQLLVLRQQRRQLTQRRGQADIGTGLQFHGAGAGQRLQHQRGVVARRQDLGAERQRLTVLEGNLRAIKGEFYPSLGLGAAVGTSGRGLDRLGGTWNVGVGLTWPLFDGLRRERRADEQRIRIDAQRLRLRDLASQVEAEARQAALDIASANDQILIAQERLRLAEQELQEARERFAAGVAGSVETTNAQADVTTARDVLIQARVAAGAAQVGAAKALGLLNQVH